MADVPLMAQTNRTFSPLRSLAGYVMSYNGLAKRLVDIVLSAFLLPILIPLIAALYLVTRRDGSPGFFGHERVGRNGVTFRCWKIRTMVPDAEARLQALLSTDAEARREWETDRKLRNDPRVTAIGALLRKTSLDELPQIWNVLKGEMSLVGPRPVTLSEIPLYGAEKHAYLTMRPGITGLWQVSGRNDLTYAERVELDARYRAGVSLVTDLAILARTALTVARRTGC